jgi:hypothetical protein
MKGNFSDALINFGKAKDLAISRNDTEREKISLDLMMKTNIEIGKQVNIFIKSRKGLYIIDRWKKRMIMNLPSIVIKSVSIL